MQFNSNQNLPNQPVGKFAKQAEVFHKRFGDIVEIVRIEICVMENGVLRKDIRFEVIPPLTDGRVVTSIEQIRECVVCEEVYHHENVSTCPVCHRTYCHACKGVIEQDDIEIIVCAECEAEAKKGLLKKLKDIFWEL